MFCRHLAVEENAVQIGNVITVGAPKTHERRSVPVPTFLAPMLAKRCEGMGHDDLVFVSPSGSGYLHRLSTTERGRGRLARCCQISRGFVGVRPPCAHGHMVGNDKRPGTVAIPTVPSL